MGRVKFNVLHWHMTDDQSFPFVGTKSAPVIHGASCDQGGGDCMGAYNQGKTSGQGGQGRQTYNMKDVRDLVAHGNANGVRVIIEIDMPAHAKAWGASDPEKYLTCYTKEYQTKDMCEQPECGPTNIGGGKESQGYKDVLALAKLIIDDIHECMSGSEHIHLGFDEVKDGCWGAEIRDQVQDDFLKDMAEYLEQLTPKRKGIYWDDAVRKTELTGVARAKGLGHIAQYWHKHLGEDAKGEEAKSLEGWNIVWTPVDKYYLDCGRGNPGVAGYASWCRPAKTWWDILSTHPGTRGDLTWDDPTTTIIGGEVPLWAEQVSDFNIESLIWPRAAALSGLLWSYSEAQAANQSMFYHLRGVHMLQMSWCTEGSPLQSQHCYENADASGSGCTVFPPGVRRLSDDKRKLVRPTAPPSRPRRLDLADDVVRDDCVWQQREPRIGFAFPKFTGSYTRPADSLGLPIKSINIDAPWGSNPAVKELVKELEQGGGTATVVVEVKEGYGSSEGYTLQRSGTTLTIVAETEPSVLRGLATIHNLIELDSDIAGLEKQTGSYRVMIADGDTIEDTPKYTHRGLMIDTAKWYISLENIYRIVYTMYRVKLNVLHWHITDDASFPLDFGESTFFVHGTKKDGAYYDSLIYNRVDVQGVVSYAASLGVRVMFEISVPRGGNKWGDHAASCSNGVLGNVKATADVPLKAVIEDIKSLSFISDGSLMHIGMRAGCSGGGDSATLDLDLVNKFLVAVTENALRPVVWDEQFDVFKDMTGDKPVVQIAGTKHTDAEYIKTITNAGFDVILSDRPHMSLDCGVTDPNNAPDKESHQCRDKFDGWNSWWDMWYSYPEQHGDKVIGGIATLWGDFVNDGNIMARLWPRAAAVAEAYWTGRDGPFARNLPDSAATADEINDAQRRIKAFSFSMMRQCLAFTPLQTQRCSYFNDFATGESNMELCDVWGLTWQTSTPAPNDPSTTAAVSAAAIPAHIVNYIVVSIASLYVLMSA